MSKVRTAMKSRQCYPMTSTVIIDDLYLEERKSKTRKDTDSKKKKVVVAVEIDDKGGIKKAYFEKIKDYSSNSLEKIFEVHISTQAKVTTDIWFGYEPLKSIYNIGNVVKNSW